MERTDEARLIEALQTIASCFNENSVIEDIAHDIDRLADAIERLADCVREDANGVTYFNISPDAD